MGGNGAALCAAGALLRIGVKLGVAGGNAVVAAGNVADGIGTDVFDVCSRER